MSSVVGKLAAADRDITGKQRPGALYDVHVHRRGPNIKQRHDVIFRRVVIDLIAVLQGKRIDVDDDRRLACELDSLFDVVDALTLARRDKDVRRLGRLGRYLIVKADIGEIVWDVLLGMPVDRFFEFFAGHRRKNDVLQNDRMAADAGDDA